MRLTEKDLKTLERIRDLGPAHTLLIDKNARDADQATLFFTGAHNETITVTVTRGFAELCLEGCLDFAYHRAVRMTNPALLALKVWRNDRRNERIDYRRLWRKFGGEDPLLWEDSNLDK